MNTNFLGIYLARECRQHFWNMTISYNPGWCGSRQEEGEADFLVCSSYLGNPRSLCKMESDFGKSSKKGALLRYSVSWFNLVNPNQKFWELWSFSFQFSSVAQSRPTPCDPMNHSTPGLPVQHQLPEFTQTHVHWVGDAI